MGMSTERNKLAPKGLIAEAHKPEIQDDIDDEVNELVDALTNTAKEETILLLQFHLYTENIFERMILGTLSRGDLLIDNGGLTYHQKLCIVEALCLLDDKYIQSLRKLNKVRNACSHEKDKEITLADIDLIGRPLGKKFTSIKRNNKATKDLMTKTFIHIGGKLISAVTRIEHVE